MRSHVFWRENRDFQNFNFLQEPTMKNYGFEILMTIYCVSVVLTALITMGVK